MRKIGAFEARTRLGTLLDRVEAGEEIVISRRGKAIARLVPNGAPPDIRKAQAAAQRIHARAKSLGAGAFDWSAWKTLFDEGRR